MSTSHIEATTSSNQPESSAPRKRRKRAPAAGAAEDCFTCSSRNIQCDRRRPYCSQCLSQGKDCSGYKTQLTWGVGVASRGKLRGLSLPIAGTQKVPAAESPPRQKKRQNTNSSVSQNGDIKHSSSLSISTSPRVPRSHGVFQTENPTPQTAPAQYAPNPWSPVDQQPSALPPAQESFQPHTLNHQNMVRQEQIRGNAQHDPVLYTRKATHNSQFEHQTNPSSMSYTSTPASYYESLPGQTINTSQSISAQPFSPLFNSPFESVFPDQSLSAYPQSDVSYVRNDTFDQSNVFSRPGHSNFDQENMPQTQEGIEELERNNFDNECAVVEDNSISPGVFSLDYSLIMSPYAGMGSIGKTPRMQYLIQYYSEVISPVIVAFDGPTNPYRTHILKLAAQSETLQHAIAALSASNLRQRCETGALSKGKTDPTRRSSIAHLHLTNAAWSTSRILSPQDQAREENFHKGYAIQSLNQQLADPLLRKDDSILATLLVLCLFHICDSGVAKFQTQFAGVKKLLNLRGNSLGLSTKEAKWFTRMFTWFDAMTASVNNREGQLQGFHLDITSLSDEEWALENLAGCDGQLFKTIAKLGRLNMLSQGKAIDSSPTIVSRPLPTIPFTNNDYRNFDGNGWMRIVADEDLFTSKSADPDVMTQFWREWREVRHALQTWRLDTSLFDTSSSEAPFLSTEQRMDLANISESFRYSALLYTERLANPSAASADANIQTWVSQSLTFIKQVKSDVYLLWPLFITGSECVNEQDRSVIRERCLDIQKDSGFFNNKSCLDLLEKVWKAHPSTATLEQSISSSGFRFSDVIKSEGVEGEYIVV